MGLIGDDHVPVVARDLLEPVPGDHHPFQAVIAERCDGAAPVPDRDRRRTVRDHQHPLRAAQIAHRRRTEHGGDRLAHARLVREQELPPAGGGVRGDRIGRLVLELARFEIIGRFGGRGGGVGVQLVLEELAEGVRARRVRREVRGQMAADEQVHLHRRMPRRPLDLRAVGDIQHPDALTGADERQLARGARGPRPARGPAATGAGTTRGGHPVRVSGAAGRAGARLMRSVHSRSVLELVQRATVVVWPT